jgi:hypothetical protein
VASVVIPELVDMVEDEMAERGDGRKGRKEERRKR